jgi:hypothetical protein
LDAPSEMPVTGVPQPFSSYDRKWGDRRQLKLPADDN